MLTNGSERPEARPRRGHPVAFLGNAVAFAAFAYVMSDVAVVMVGAILGAIWMAICFAVQMRRRRT